MKKSNYLSERLERLLKGDIRRSKITQIRIKRGYKRAFQLIEDDIAKYVTRISDDLKLDSKALKRKIPKEELLSRAKELKLEEETMANYENLSYAEAIRREMVKNVESMAKENESLIFENLFKTYEHNYYSTSYLLYKTMDDFSFTKRVTREYFDWMAKKPWTSDGRTFSDRIWNDQKTLVDELYKEFTVSATRGANLKEAARRMSRKMDVSYKKCLRLLNTEDSFFSNKAVMDAYQNTTAEEYMILATLDRRTCEICGDQDTKHYKIKDAKVGVNMPPFHPNCRCTTVVYFGDEDMPEERMMRDENGKSVKTEYMSYDEWKKKYVDKVDDMGYNISEEKEIIIEDLPDTLKKFEAYSQAWEDEVVKKQLSEEEINCIGDNIQKIINENEYSMRVRADILDKILDDGRFKNQFETNTSGGLLDLEARKEASEQLFGNFGLKIDGIDREKYGYLGLKDFIEDDRTSLASQYGNCIIHFDKNKLKNMVTYTIEDSLEPASGKIIVAGNAENARANGIRNTWLKRTSNVFKENKDISLNDLLLNMDSDYFELQYHGEIRTDAIKEICFVNKYGDDLSEMVNIETIDRLKKMNIKVYEMIDDFGGEKIVEI